MMLDRHNTLLVLIDVQEKLTAFMHERDQLIEKLITLVKGIQLLDIPIIWLEQKPDKMGPTIPELRPLLEGQTPLTKKSFSCCGATEFNAALEDADRKQILIAGIETHVCVYQTAVDLIRKSYAAEVIVDAVSSRHASDKTAAIAKIQACGAHSAGSGQGHITTVETALFELLRDADHPRFREILRIVK